MPMLDTIDVPDDPKEQKRLADAIKNLSNLKTMAKAAADAFTEAKKAVKDDFSLDNDTVTTMFNLYHNQTSETYFQKQDDLHTLYETLFNTSNGDSNG